MEAGLTDTFAIWNGFLKWLKHKLQNLKEKRYSKLMYYPHDIDF